MTGTPAAGRLVRRLRRQPSRREQIRVLELRLTAAEHHLEAYDQMLAALGREDTRTARTPHLRLVGTDRGQAS